MFICPSAIMYMTRRFRRNILPRSLLVFLIAFTAFNLLYIAFSVRRTAHSQSSLSVKSIPSLHHRRQGNAISNQLSSVSNMGWSWGKLDASITSQESSSVFIAIQSYPEHAEQRKLLRETWLSWREDSTTTYTFYIPTTISTLSIDLLREYDTYQDMIFIPAQLNNTHQAQPKLIRHPSHQLPPFYSNLDSFVSPTTDSDTDETSTLPVQLRSNPFHLVGTLPPLHVSFYPLYHSYRISNYTHFVYIKTTQTFLCLHRLLYELDNQPKNNLFWVRYASQTKRRITTLPTPDDSFYVLSSDLAEKIVEGISANALVMDAWKKLVHNIGYWSYFWKLRIFDDRDRIDTKAGYLTDFMHKEFFSELSDFDDDKQNGDSLNMKSNVDRKSWIFKSNLKANMVIDPKYILQDDDGSTDLDEIHPDVLSEDFSEAPPADVPLSQSDPAKLLDQSFQRSANSFDESLSNANPQSNIPKQEAIPLYQIFCKTYLVASPVPPSILKLTYQSTQLESSYEIPRITGPSFEAGGIEVGTALKAKDLDQKWQVPRCKCESGPVMIED
ncbi:hypothetical protein BKA69DRAFT_1070748, partial [Paraphysoderma sedebokerense]